MSCLEGRKSRNIVINECNRELRIWFARADLLKHEQPELRLPCLDQRFGFGCLAAVFAGYVPVREDLFNGICSEGGSLSPPLSESKHDS